MSTIRPIKETARWAVIAGRAMLEGETRVGELTGVQIGLPVAFGEGEKAFAEAVRDAPRAFTDAALTAVRADDVRDYCMICRREIATESGQVCKRCGELTAECGTGVRGRV